MDRFELADSGLAIRQPASLKFLLESDMAFRAPTFNLLCDIYSFGDYGINPARLTGVACQWRTVAKLQNLAGAAAAVASSFVTEILFPAATDVRGSDETPIGAYDTVVLTGPLPPAAPFAAPLPFIAGFVYDVAKGFTNEYRVAAVTKLPPWPTPIP